MLLATWGKGQNGFVKVKVGVLCGQIAKYITLVAKANAVIWW